MKRLGLVLFGLFIFFLGCSSGKLKPLTDYVDPFLGTETLWDSIDLGYYPHIRQWGGEVFPGSALPFAMVQASPVTQFRSGAGYQYEDTVIYGFSHTNKGHWNLNHVPVLPVTGNIDRDDYASGYSHERESARPGYYQVYLERYGVNAELTTTLRCAVHRHTYSPGDEKKLMLDLRRSNEHVRGWEISEVGDNAFAGYQDTGYKVYFYAVADHGITGIDLIGEDKDCVQVVNFGGRPAGPLEVKIGFSFVSVENARMNLEAEVGSRTFDEVFAEADKTWNEFLSKIRVDGGTEQQYRTFYSTFYRSMLWPALRSDVNGEYTDARSEVVNNGFRYYTDPSFWDEYRNKLILIGMVDEGVTVDVIESMIDRGEKRGGFMPIFFHGDHASSFIAGNYLRGIKGFDIERAYNLMLRNATVTENNRARPLLAEYIELGYVPEQDLEDPQLATVANAAVTKTQEYAYDDYSVALIAKELGDKENFSTLMGRASNYKNVFDPETQFMRGRLADGSWIENFDPGRPFYEYMYREANAWQSTFFAPHDPYGLVDLFGSAEAFEAKLDSLFTVPYTGGQAHNLSVFIGQYCHGNQPSHGFTHMYYFVDKQPKSQLYINKILDEFYNMGENGLAYAGMDDSGEMSSWYVLNAIGLYTLSPSDPEYIVSVPLFREIRFRLDQNGRDFTIVRNGTGNTIKSIKYDGKPVEGYFIGHDDLLKGGTLVIEVE
ncbi:MAG: GH92 family glycosyl hydrolase [Rikenellaceae bacterium]|nr:GH92 family glycosyl hydrolase [Rikenellaceae bacterium]